MEQTPCDMNIATYCTSAIKEELRKKDFRSAGSFSCGHILFEYYRCPQTEETILAQITDDNAIVLYKQISNTGQCGGIWIKSQTE